MVRFGVSRSGTECINLRKVCIDMRTLLADGRHGIYTGFILAERFGECLALALKDLEILKDGPNGDNPDAFWEESVS